MHPKDTHRSALMRILCLPTLKIGKQSTLNAPVQGPLAMHIQYSWKGMVGTVKGFWRGQIRLLSLQLVNSVDQRKCTAKICKNICVKSHIYSIPFAELIVLISSQTVKTSFDKRDLGQTNEQQRHFNEQPIKWVEWGGRFHPNQFKTTFYPPAIMGMSSLSFSSDNFKAWHFCIVF
jgi:hypothetical protein